MAPHGWLRVPAAAALLTAAFLTGVPVAQRGAVVLIPAPAADRPVPATGDARLQYFRARIAADGEIPVIVEFRTPGLRPLAEVVDPGDESGQEPLIAAARQRLEQRLPPRARPVRAFDSIPFVALRADFATLEILRADPDVISIQEDGLRFPTLAQSVPLIQGHLAWAAGYTGKGRAVAILDTGVEKIHSAFEGRVVSEACYSGGGLTSRSLCPGGALASTAAGSGVPCTFNSDCSHGTHVAGIAAGSNGVARDASIIAIQVFSNAFGNAGAYDSDIIAGLSRVYALRKKYDIAAVNMSLGSGFFSAACDSESPAMAAVVNNLHAYRIATVVASGNDGYTSGISFPACLSKAVSVGSTTKSDDVSSFSNAAAILSLLAPGSSITAPVPGGGTGIKSGTSMAAPHVAGAWAILEHKTPGLKVATGLSVLKSTGLGIVDSGNGLTFRRIRINNALGKLTALPAAVTISPSGPGAPPFVWNRVAASTKYRLLVRLATGGAPVVNTWYSASSVCGSTTCSVAPVVTLTPGATYNWWIQTFDFGAGPMSAVRSFTPSTGSPPPATTLVSPTGTAGTTPTYTWNNLGTATSYRLFVQPAAGGTAVIDSQHTTASACAGTTCAVTPGTALTTGTQYRWRIRTRNGAGYGPWSAFMTFTPIKLPPVPTPAAPSGAVNTLSPTFSWNKVSRTTVYQLYIQPAAGGAAASPNYTATAICGASTCSVIPSVSLTAGTTYRWRVRGKNAAGVGPWSVYKTFTPSAGLPGGATLISPNSALANQFPTYRWNKVASATRYYLTVRSASAVVFSKYYFATDVCGSTTCEITPPNPLGSGSFSWRIQTRNGTGYGPASAAMGFSTVAPRMSIVLSWGANPADLDSHLLTPSGHHVYFFSRGSATSLPFATLDVDDRTGFGPETIFIHQAQSGSYRYYVHRWAGSGTLAGSGAKVRIYRGSTLLATYTAPATGTGDYWHVCTITNASTGARTCPNTIGTLPPADSFGNIPAEAPGKKDEMGVGGQDTGAGESPGGKTPPVPGRKPRLPERR